MLEQDMTKEEKLRKAKDLFEQALDWYEPWFEDTEKAYDTRDGEQWDDEDLKLLQEQGRPALTFNVTRGRVNHHVGSHEDNRQKVTMEPVGREDQFTADVLNHLVTRMRKQCRADDHDSMVFEDGIVCGIGMSVLEVEPDPSRPTWVRTRQPRVDPMEVKWDPASSLPGREDARYLMWDKWLSKAEFKAEYPQFGEDVEEIMLMRDQHGYRRHAPEEKYEYAIPEPDNYRRVGDLTYYDRQRELVRVIHMEYKQAFQRVYVVNPETGRNREVDPALAGIVLDMYDDAEIIEVWDEKWFWFEFIGDLVLYDDESPMPYEGFSVDAFVCYNAYRTGLPYGVVKDLIDPQSEVNKRQSQLLNLLIQQVQPGMLAETTATDDQEQFEASLGEAGSTTWLKAGGLERIKERDVPNFPEAPARLSDISMKMIEIISGVFTDDLTTPRGIPEAAATAQLRHRKGQLSTLGIHKGFHAYQLSRGRKEIQVVVNAMPDDQIEALLGDSERFDVRGDGIIEDRKNGFQLDIRDLRDIEINVDLDVADANNSQRLLEQNTLSGLAKDGFPVDPEVVFDLTTLSADKKTRLIRYAQQQIEQARADDAAKSESLQRQLDTEHQLEAMGLRIKATEGAEKSRHNIATEILGALKEATGREVKVLEIWERADADEKRVLTQLFAAVQQRQTERARRQIGAGA